MATIEFGEKTITPGVCTRTLYGSDERDLVGDQRIKVQFTGSGSEISCQVGPPTGKKWRVFTQIHVSESDI